jgi:NAD(P)H-dependent flavin oxidoreductase YrpB (nitropropane dioxygenase family)
MGVIAPKLQTNRGSRGSAGEPRRRAVRVGKRTARAGALMSSGQVAGLIDDLPSCQELIEAITAEAERCLDRLAAVRKA